MYKVEPRMVKGFKPKKKKKNFKEKYSESDSLYIVKIEKNNKLKSIYSR